MPESPARGRSGDESSPIARLSAAGAAAVALSDRGSDAPHHRVLIVGGGFGGLATAQALAGAPGIHVTLVDRHNYHLFQPLLYQVATAVLSPGEIAEPIRRILSGCRNITVLLGEVEAIDPVRREVHLSEGKSLA